MKKGRIGGQKMVAKEGKVLMGLLWYHEPSVPHIYQEAFAGNGEGRREKMKEREEVGYI